MAKGKDTDIAPAPVEPEPQTGCVVCGQYGGEFEAVTSKARAHKACSESRPDVIAKVKARA